MAAPIEIGALEETEAIDLVNALAARGLVGTPAERGSVTWVAVCDAHEDTERLLGDVAAAVASWLAERDRPPLELRVGSRVETVAGRRDIRDVLDARAAAKVRPGGRPP